MVPLRPVVPSLRPVAWVALAALVALGAACAAGRGPGRAPAGARATLDVAGTPRTYRHHVPAGLDPARPVALLLVFHGAGSDADDIARGSGFDALADTVPMVVVYPEALGGRFDVASPDSADLRFVDALVADLRGRHTIDPRRVFASGFSNGAAFCYRLAASRPGLLAAIAPVAGYLPPVGATGEPVPLLHVHGSADRRVAAPALAGGPSDPVATWARRNGATRGPIVADVAGMDGLSVRGATYTGSTPRADATLWLVEGEDHTWPGGPAGPVSRGLLDFLRAHAR